MAYVNNPTEVDKREWRKLAKQQEEQMREMVRSLAESYQKDPADIAELLAFGSRFYQYSVRNNMLIYKQNPHAVYVQSFQAWKKEGVSVKKGEKGIKVYVPVRATILKIGSKLVPLEQASREEKIKYQAGEIESITKSNFKLGTVFDIAQTTYPKEKYPKLFHMGYPSDLHGELADCLAEYADKYLGCSVVIENLGSISLRGDFDPITNTIRLNEQLEDTQKLSTLTHELGHAILHQKMDTPSVQKELEADALGIMIENHFGIGPTEPRRRHLAENYHAYRAEYEAQEGMESFGGILKNVYQMFKENLLEMEQTVERHIPAAVQPMQQRQKQASQGENRKLTQREIYDEIKQRVTIQDYAAMHGFAVRRVGKYYTLKEHNSVRIDTNKNCFWRNSGINPMTHQAVAENASGSVIDFALMFVHNGDLHEALSELQGMIDLTGVPHRNRQKQSSKKSLEENLPEKAANMRRAFAYLTKSRYIDPDVVQEFVDRKMLYQDVRGNCVFIAYGKDGKPNFATFRGTLTEKRFLGDVPGNDYIRGFYIDNDSAKVVVTESVIDAMSVMTILKGQGADYHAYDYSIEAGTGKSATLLIHLQEKPMEEALLSMDHDIAGISAMEGLTKEIGGLGLPTKVSCHVPSVEQKDWNGELSSAAKRMQPMDSVPYLEDRPLPKIHYCAAQSTEQVEERGFRKREERHQYRLVEERDGKILPMDIKRNVIYTDPKELKALMPPMYVMVDYAQMEKAAAEHTAGQKNIVEKEQQENSLGKAVEVKMEIREFITRDGICMVTADTAVGIEELAVWKRGEHIYVETGNFFEGTLVKHSLEGETADKLKEYLGNETSGLPDGFLYHKGTGQESEGMLKESTSPQADFLENIQKQEQSRNRQVMARQPGMSMEIEI